MGLLSTLANVLFRAQSFGFGQAVFATVIDQGVRSARRRANSLHGRV